MRSNTLLAAPILLVLFGCAANPEAVTQTARTNTVYAMPVYVLPNCSDVAGRCYWIEPRAQGGQVALPPQKPKRVEGIAL